MCVRSVGYMYRAKNPGSSCLFCQVLPLCALTLPSWPKMKRCIEVPHPVASVAMYEGRDRGVNPISVVTECDWHSNGCGRPVTSDSHADPEG